MTRHALQLLKVKRSKVKVTRSRDVSADKNALTRQCMHISTSNLVGIINAVALMGCQVAQLVKCLVTSGYPDGSSSGGPGSNPGKNKNF